MYFQVVTGGSFRHRVGRVPVLVVQKKVAMEHHLPLLEPAPRRALCRLGWRLLSPGWA